MFRRPAAGGGMAGERDPHVEVGRRNPCAAPRPATRAAFTWPAPGDGPRRETWMPATSPLLTGLDELDRVQGLDTGGLPAHPPDRDTDCCALALAILVHPFVTQAPGLLPGASHDGVGERQHLPSCPDLFRAPMGAATLPGRPPCAWRCRMGGRNKSGHDVAGGVPGTHGRGGENRVRPASKIQTGQRWNESGHDDVRERRGRRGWPASFDAPLSGPPRG